jgi:hypothetical protein
MKKIIAIQSLIPIFLLCGLFFTGYAQSISVFSTQYTKTNDEDVGKENFTFSMSNSYITITDLDYNKSENYGPLKFESSGFSGGYYYEGYVTDIAKDPLRFRREMARVYKFYFEKKNGTIIAIIEGKLRPDNSYMMKTFYTELGNKLLNGNK